MGKIDSELEQIRTQFEAETHTQLDKAVQQLVLNLYLSGEGFQGWVFCTEEIHEILVHALGDELSDQYIAYFKYAVQSNRQKFTSPETTPKTDSSFEAKRQYAQRNKIHHLDSRAHVGWINEKQEECSFLRELVKRGFISYDELMMIKIHAIELIQLIARPVYGDQLPTKIKVDYSPEESQTHGIVFFQESSQEELSLTVIN